MKVICSIFVTARAGSTAVAFRRHTLLPLDDCLYTLQAYDYAKRLKTLNGLPPYEYIGKCWTETPDRFRLSPFHHTAGLNI
jgi:hypothetical protein